MPGAARVSGRRRGRACGGRRGRRRSSGTSPASSAGHRPTIAGRRVGPTPEDRRAAGAHERQAELRRHRRLRERLRERDAERVRPPAPRRDPTRRARSAAPTARGSRTCGAPPRAATTSRSGSASAIGIPGEPPPEPTSTIGPSKARTSSPRAGRRRRASRAPRQGRAAPVMPASLDDGPSQRRASRHGRTSSCQSRPPVASKPVCGRPGAAPSYTATRSSGDAATNALHVPGVQYGHLVQLLVHLAGARAGEHLEDGAVQLRAALGRPRLDRPRRTHALPVAVDLPSRGIADDGARPRAARGSRPPGLSARAIARRCDATARRREVAERVDRADRAVERAEVEARHVARERRLHPRHASERARPSPATSRFP